MSKLVFGIMSAVHKADTVAQLCEALAPHQVVIHHDFTQQPDFSVDLPNVEFVPDARPTGWDSFAFTDGILRLLEFCLSKPEMEYFQLLSPTCLPIRPVAEFAGHVFRPDRMQEVAADVDGIDILANDQALVNFGYRVFVPRDTLRMRALFKASKWYFGLNGPEEIRAGLSVRVEGEQAESLPGKLGKLMLRAAAAGLFGKHPFGSTYLPVIGSAWFGASRQAAQYLFDHASDEQEMAYYRTLAFADELVIPTVLHNGPFEVAQANHLLNAFEGPRPTTFTLADVHDLQPGTKFFARKFADDVNDPARLALLDRLKSM